MTKIVLSVLISLYIIPFEFCRIKVIKTIKPFAPPIQKPVSRIMQKEIKAVYNVGTCLLNIYNSRSLVPYLGHRTLFCTQRIIYEVQIINKRISSLVIMYNAVQSPQLNHLNIKALNEAHFKIIKSMVVKQEFLSCSKR